MKSFSYFLIPALVLTLTTAFGQALNVSTYMEQTRISPKLGATVGVKWTGSYAYYNRPFSFELGGFYQECTMPEEGETATTEVENNFAGVYFETPLIYMRAFTLDLNVRTGLQNGEYFLITPAAKARYAFGDNLSVGAGVGSRSFQPTMMFDVKLAL